MSSLHFREWVHPQAICGPLRNFDFETLDELIRKLLSHYTPTEFEKHKYRHSILTRTKTKQGFGLWTSSETELKNFWLIGFVDGPQNTPELLNIELREMPDECSQGFAAATVFKPITH